MVVWRAFFNLREDKEADALETFLAENLKEPHIFKVVRDVFSEHAKHILIIESPTKDDCFKVAEWLRHRNPLGRKLFYSVIARIKDRIVWASWCQECRAGVPHHHGAVA